MFLKLIFGRRVSLIAIKLQEEVLRFAWGGNRLCESVIYYYSIMVTGLILGGETKHRNYMHHRSFCGGKQINITVCFSNMDLHRSG